MKARTKPWFALIVLAVTVLGMIALWPRSARAAGPWYVAPGGSDSNSCLSTGSPCATINGAIGKASPGDTIYVATGTYTASVGSEVVLIDKNIILSGGWNSGFTTQSGMSTIDGEGVRQGMRVSNGVMVSVEHFTVQNGAVVTILTLCASSVGGGGICNEGNLTLNNSEIISNTSSVNVGGNGGGIFTCGILSMVNSSVKNNTASSGGGILNSSYNCSGAVTLSNTIISNNTATGVGGGCGFGGGIASSGTLTLTTSTVSGNTANDSCGIGGGGGLSISGGTTTLNNSTVSGNAVTTNVGPGNSSAGGGIYNIGGTVILNNSAIVGNTASASGTSVPPGVFIGASFGGGLYSYGGTLSLNNDTVKDNTARVVGGGASAYGGGIYATQSNILNLNNVTFGQNAAGDNDDTGHGGGIYQDASSSTTTLKNTILAANIASAGPNCEGTIVSADHNLIGNTSGCTFSASPNDLLNTNPKFVTVGNYYALLFGSPAIDAGNPAGCTDYLGNPLTTDQRGAPRPLDGDGNSSAICDIGAYELDPNNPIRQIFLPLVRTTCKLGICGRVALNGTPTAGVSLELRFFNGSYWSTLATTTTNSNGDYAFTGMPGLAPGQRYYARYRNYANTPGRLWVWGTRDLTSYAAGSAVEIGNFDIADIPLISPPAGATVALPYTFQWTRRPATPSDTYEFDIYDPTDGDPYAYTVPPLGYVGNFTMNSLPPGFGSGAQYGWEIWVYSPDGGYGISQETRLVTFSNTGQSISTASQTLRLEPHDLEDALKRR